MTNNVDHLFYRLEYTCHGTWRENQTTFIIARHAGTKHGVCISFKQSTTDTAQLYIGDSCYRDHQGPDAYSERQHTLANLTHVGRKLMTFCIIYSSAPNRHFDLLPNRQVWRSQLFHQIGRKRTLDWFAVVPNGLRSKMICFSGPMSQQPGAMEMLIFYICKFFCTYTEGNEELCLNYFLLYTVSN